jgi:hypothetical protein
VSTVQNMALAWQQATVVAGAAVGTGAVLRVAGGARLRRLAAVPLEVGIIAALYALWQYAASQALGHSAGAFARAHWILRAEDRLHLPSERNLQDVILGHPLLVQGANLYYDSMHFTGLFVFLLWLFFRHRDHYAPIRRTLALTTLCCLLVQLHPVAPPRLLPGFVDTASVYHQSVYADAAFGADHFSAMPSVHVAWAVLIGWYAVRVGRSGWRWIGAGHAVLTMLVVVATANHYWADGIVAAAILAACAAVQSASTTAGRRLRDRLRRPDTAEPIPPVPASEPQMS